MKYIVGLFCGLLSAFLFYMAIGMAMAPLEAGGEEPSKLLLFVFILFWVGAVYFITNKTSGFLKPMARASFLGMLNWIFIGVAGLIYTGRAVSHVAGETPDAAAKVGTAIGGGFVALLTGGVSAVMIIVCLACFLGFYIASKETS